MGLGLNGTGIVIGNQDTGVSWTHNALKPHYRGWNGSSATTTTTGGTRFTSTSRHLGRTLRAQQQVPATTTLTAPTRTRRPGAVRRRGFPVNLLVGR